MIAVADSGFVLAVANPRDEYHQACLKVYKAATIIHVPQSTFAEVGYMPTRDAGNRAVVRFLSQLHTTKYRLEALEPDDLLRMAELLEKYADTRLDFVDVSITAVAERLNIRTILTVDPRDCHIIRPIHTEYFDLLPEA
jgi:uncharacterized protein